MQSTDLQVIKEIPGYKVILKTVLKSQIQQLVEQLADHTGEESVILTASVSDGSLSHLGSDAGKVFLEDHDDIKSQFLGFCLKHHHKQKQLEKEKEEREKQQQQQQLQDPGGQMLMAPTTPTRFAPGPRPRFSPSRIHTSPRQFSPRGVHPVSLTRASPRGGAPGVRHEPYPGGARPRKPLNFDPNRRPQPSSSMRLPTDPGSAQKINTKPNEVIKIEAMDEDEENAEKSRTEERKSSVDSGQGESGSGTEPNATTTATSMPPTPTDSIHSPAVRDDGSESSSSTIPNEPAEVKYSDTLPPEGLGLDSDLSNLMGAPPDTANSDTSTGDSASIDPNVSVKVEAIADSDDLEITGVEPGQMAQPDYGMMPNLQSMGYSPSTSGGAQGGMGDQSSQGYSTHVSEVGGVTCKMHRCLFCGKIFDRKDHMIRHVRIHTGEKPWSCGLCLRRFNTSNSLKRHQLTHKNMSNFRVDHYQNSVVVVLNDGSTTITELNTTDQPNITRSDMSYAEQTRIKTEEEQALVDLLNL